MEEFERLIFATLPWTGADRAQIIARLNRPGQIGTTEVLIPQVAGEASKSSRR